MIDPFLGRLFDIITSQLFNKRRVHRRINAKEKQGQPIEGDAPYTQYPFRGRGKFAPFGDTPFLPGTGRRRKRGGCLTGGNLRGFRGCLLRTLRRLFRDRNGFSDFRRPAWRGLGNSRRLGWGRLSRPSWDGFGGPARRNFGGFRGPGRGGFNGLRGDVLGRRLGMGFRTLDSVFGWRGLWRNLFFGN
jgi:hypothetical protein